MQTGASAFAVLCAVNGISMVIAGYLSDLYSRTILLALIFVGRAAAFLLLILSIDAGGTSAGEGWLYVFSVLFGLCDYAVVPPVVSLVTTHAGEESVGLGVGILLAWHSLGASIGSILGGALFDAHGNYTLALIVCAFLCLVAAVASITICPEPLFRWKSKEIAMVVVEEEEEEEARKSGGSEEGRKTGSDWFCDENCGQNFVVF